MRGFAVLSLFLPSTASHHMTYSLGSRALSHLGIWPRITLHSRIIWDLSTNDVISFEIGKVLDEICILFRKRETAAVSNHAFNTLRKWPHTKELLRHRSQKKHFNKNFLVQVTALTHVQYPLRLTLISWSSSPFTLPAPFFDGDWSVRLDIFLGVRKMDP